MDEKKNGNQGLIVGVIVGILAVSLIGALVGGAFYWKNNQQKQMTEKVTTFINEQLIGGEGQATVKYVGKNNGLHQFEVEYMGQKIDTFLSADGKKFFPQGFDMEPQKDADSEGANIGDGQPVVEAPKSDKPKVEVFVMSYCPYGTQMQKGIMPAIDALGDKIDFDLKFVDYIMHGEEEAQENLRQYCINKEQKNKLSSYLSCFLKSGESAPCLKTAGVDEGKLTKCYGDSDKQFKVSELMKDTSSTYPPFAVNGDDNEKYGVSGSPTLVINGAIINSSRDSASLLKTICSAFNNAPQECQTELSNATPAPGFGDGTTASASTASCN